MAERFFRIKHLGPVNNYLGVEVTQTPEGYYELCQQNKIAKLLQEYGLSEAKSVATPMVTGYIKKPNDELWEDVQRYQSLIGSLLYLSCWSRPDISYAVHLLCQRGACPYRRDWTAAKRILRYLKGTISYKLVLRVSGEVQVQAYCDASWTDHPDGKSMTVLLIFLGNALIMHKSVKQSLVATSTCEAEYAALSECVIHLEWIFQLLQDMKIECKVPISILCDNTAAQHLAEYFGAK
ncbi:uncharacterized protein LOC129324337 [Eublepharis macularius]|uniref:Uncharacterized protein LOC129324337 n=1 Tax=Eublepharis macularius TaxID=481883 RepID=A0AA97IXN5_EUBMA|nr:uncharacterized protein LOC129324337 [Eublepharis macularius]